MESGDGLPPKRRWNVCGPDVLKSLRLHRISWFHLFLAYYKFYYLLAINYEMNLRRWCWFILISCNNNCVFLLRVLILDEKWRNDDDVN